MADAQVDCAGLRIGAIWPGEEFSEGIAGLDAWVDAVETGGYHHVIFGDHVVGIDPAKASPGWSRGWPGLGPPYTHQTLYREPLTLLSYLAGRCSLELVTGVVVAPQRQTALLAKQAAELDILSSGRARLGLGTGWNAGEYEVLGADFSTRGRMLDEQIDVLRLLWTEDSMTFHGEFHSIDGAGIMTPPVQRPIPIWLGGDSEAARRRVGTRGDGWLLLGRVQPDSTLRRRIDGVRQIAEAAGRDSDRIGIEGRLVVGSQTDEEIASAFARWRDLGASHLCVDTRYAGIGTVEGHIRSVRRVASIFNGIG